MLFEVLDCAAHTLACAEVVRACRDGLVGRSSSPRSDATPVMVGIFATGKSASFPGPSRPPHGSCIVVRARIVLSQSPSWMYR